MNSANNPYFNSSFDALAAKTSAFVINEIIAVVNTPEKIEKAVERYAEHFYEIDEEFEGETLEEYKDYMRDSLLLYLKLNIDPNSEEFRNMSFRESGNYLLHIKEKYRKIFFDYKMENR